MIKRIPSASGPGHLIAAAPTFIFASRYYFFGSHSYWAWAKGARFNNDVFLVIGVGGIVIDDYIQLCRNRKVDLRLIKGTIMPLLCMQVGFSQEACLDASCPVPGAGF